MPHVRLGLATATALAALALVACGEDAEEKFRDDYRPLNQQIRKLDSDMRNALERVRRSSNAQIEKRFGAFAQTAGELQQQVDELEPPQDDAKDEQEDLTESLGDVQNALEDIERAADDNDPAAARTGAVQLVTSIGEMRSARTQLARAADL